MSIPTQALKYGWVALATLTIGGASIFVVNNQMARINTATRIEIVLGTIERCLATQTGTNADGSPICAVAPPEIVSSWYSNSYVPTVLTNGESIITNWTAVLWTNIVTNAIGWLDDPEVKDVFDAKIKELVPYYVNTNTLSGGSSNIDTLTVTGLWADLNIGDGTNLFTAIPCWTNSTGQVVVATYGAWPWRNYVTDWHERYKVLNALKITARSQEAIIRNRMVDFAFYLNTNTVLQTLTWAEAKAAVDALFVTGVDSEHAFTWTNTAYLDDEYAGFRIFTVALLRTSWPDAALVSQGQEILGFVPFWSSTQMTASVQIYYRCDPTQSIYVAAGWPSAIPMAFEGYGLVGDGSYHLLPGTNFGLNLPSECPVWCDDATTNSWAYQYSGDDDWYYFEARGTKIQSCQTLQTWQFSYCTNNFW